MSLLGDLFGVPGTDAEREQTVANLTAGRTVNEAAEYLRISVHHNTEKAGAFRGAGHFRRGRNLRAGA